MIKVIADDKQVILNLTKEEQKKIEESLTFDNPKYQSAMKFSGYSYTKIPRTLKFFKRIKYWDVNVEKDALEVPRFFDVSKCLNHKDIWTDVVYRKHENVAVYPNFKLELREAQKDAVESYLVEHHLSSTYPRSIIQLPTGKGKTILAIYLASRIHAKTIVLVHKTDLVVGWTKDIKECFGEDFDVGIIQAKKKHISDFITIATVQTIYRMSDEEKAELFSSFNLAILDEVHNVNDNMFSVIDDFKSEFKLGLSATPVRSDGRNYLFDLYFGGIVYKYEYKEEDEDICSAEVITTKTNYKYKPFLYEGRVFNYYAYKREELPEFPIFVEELEYNDRPNIPHQIIDSDRVNSPKYKFKVCQQIVNEYRQGHSILCLFNLKEDIRNYYKFLSNFIPKDQILLFYGDSTEKVDVMLEKAESKECLVTLATYSKAKEGTNVKSWEVLFLVSSINDAKNTEQAVGRIRRKKEDKLKVVRIYDYPADDVYSMRKHFSTRMSVYKKLKFKIDGVKSNKLFSRGY